MTIIRPSPAATNAPPDELLPAGVINFPATDLNQVLKIYAELVNRTVLRPTALPAPTITLVTQTPLTKREAKQAFDAVLALNGIAMIDVGDKFVKVVPTAQAGQVGAPFSKQPIDQIPDMGQYVTHIVQLTNAKPSEMVQALTPFASPGQQGILPIDSSQILVLRDYSENVKRMLEMIKKIDVAVPAEYISEVIPIKYALASDIASALNSLSSGGGGTTVGSAGAGGGGARGGGGGARGSNFGRGSTGTYPGSTTPGMTSPFGATPGATTPGSEQLHATPAEPHQPRERVGRNPGPGPNENHRGRAHEFPADLRFARRHENDQGHRFQTGRGAGPGANRSGHRPGFAG
jgi:uncharacterized membrane protein YgcG